MSCDPLSDAASVRSFLSSCAAGSESEALALLSRWPLLARAHDPRGVSALMHAVRSGSRSLPHALLTCAKPARPRAVDDVGRSALHYAAIHGNAAAARSLMQFGADVRACCGAGRTPLDECTEYETLGVAAAIAAAAPGACAPPSPPPPVELGVVAGEGALRLTWAAAAGGDRGGRSEAAESHWRLQVAEAAAEEGGVRASRWITVRLTTRALSTTVFALRAGGRYTFRLARANAWGWSAWGEASASMTAGGEEGAAGAGAADSLATLFEVAASCDARMSELLRRAAAVRAGHPEEGAPQRQRVSAALQLPHAPSPPVRTAAVRGAAKMSGREQASGVALESGVALASGASLARGAALASGVAPASGAAQASGAARASGAAPIDPEADAPDAPFIIPSLECRPPVPSAAATPLRSPGLPRTLSASDALGRRDAVPAPSVLFWGVAAPCGVPAPRAARAGPRSPPLTRPASAAQAAPTGMA